MSEIQTVWKRDATELSEIQTSSDFRHSLQMAVRNLDIQNPTVWKRDATELSEIQTMPKSEQSSEFRQSGFQMFGLLELHLNCLKSELATSTIKQH